MTTGGSPPSHLEGLWGRSSVWDRGWHNQNFCPEDLLGGEEQETQEAL